MTMFPCWIFSLEWYKVIIKSLTAATERLSKGVSFIMNN